MIKRFPTLFSLFIALLSLVVPSHSAENAPIYGYRIVNAFTHNPDSYTQGLLYNNGFLYEGTGQWTKSKLLKVELETGEVLQEQKLDDRYFGEGIAVVADRIVQLTWRSKKGFVYQKDNFQLIQEFAYPTEGWGLAFNNEHLILSDGTANLYFLNPTTFEEQRRVTVHDGAKTIRYLNELEWIEGEIFANIWYEDRIARIDPKSGMITGWIDLSDIRSRASIPAAAEVLNGIAYDAEHKRLFITGKLWPQLFEIELISPSSRVQDWKTNQ